MLTPLPLIEANGVRNWECKLLSSEVFYFMCLAFKKISEKIY